MIDDLPPTQCALPDGRSARLGGHPPPSAPAKSEGVDALILGQNCGRLAPFSGAFTGRALRGFAVRAVVAFQRHAAERTWMAMVPGADSMRPGIQVLDPAMAGLPASEPAGVLQPPWTSVKPHAVLLPRAWPQPGAVDGHYCCGSRLSGRLWPCLHVAAGIWWLPRGDHVRQCAPRVVGSAARLRGH